MSCCFFFFFKYNKVIGQVWGFMRFFGRWCFNVCFSSKKKRLLSFGLCLFCLVEVVVEVVFVLFFFVDHCFCVCLCWIVCIVLVVCLPSLLPVLVVIVIVVVWCVLRLVWFHVCVAVTMVAILAMLMVSVDL